MHKRWREVFSFLLLLTLLSGIPARAQTGVNATLSRPDAQAFPFIEAYMTVKDLAGQFLHGLQPNSLKIIEDNRTLALDQLEELHPGAQVVVAINPGPPFALRDSQGNSRSNFIQGALENWSQALRGSNQDDLSMLITDGTEITHLKDPQKWYSSINLEEIDARQATPSLDTLARAVEIAADPTGQPGMGKAVLFITSPDENQSAQAIDNIIARAKEQGVSVFIWMVPVPGAFYPNAEKQFQQLTSQTGGQLFTFTDEQPTLDLESFLESFRSIYRLRYASQIRSSGKHQLAVDIQTPDGAVTTPVQEFDLNVLPPEPAFVSPPLNIQRQPPLADNGQPDENAELVEYLPLSQEIEVIVSFPDERQRQLNRTSLYVDGELVQENRRAPFERFIWDVRKYVSSGGHMLRVEAEDNLGLIGTSIEHQVQVNLLQPPRSPWGWVFNNAAALSILGAVVAGAVLVLVLVLGGRLQPRQPGKTKTRQRKSDPVTQPVPVKVEAPVKKNSTWAGRIHWPQRNIQPKADAFLTRITDSDGEIDATPIPIMTDEITLGSDSGLATLVLNDPSIEPLHARIIRQEDGGYRLNDEGSIAGTWINYTPISREGTALEHGDLVHIGRIGFHFTLRQAGQARKAVAAPVEQADQDGE